MTTSSSDSAPVFPDVPLSLVRPAILSGLLVVVAVAAGAYLGHIMFGIWMFVGLALSLANAKLVQLYVQGITAEENPRKRPVAINSVLRLALLTVVALVVAFLARPDGIGVMFGLALSQVILVLNTVIPVMKGLRTQS